MRYRESKKEKAKTFSPFNRIDYNKVKNIYPIKHTPKVLNTVRGN